MKELDILKPNIFPDDRIISGVTKRNTALFPNKGFTLSHNGITNSEFKRNLQIFSDFLGVQVSDIRFNHQIHSDKIVIADHDFKIEQADALITNRQNIVIYVKIADCAGILIYEPTAECVAAIHSGWKGTKLNIAGKTIKELQKQYNAKPSNMLVYISPMASAKNYEVGREFFDYFPKDVLYENNNKLFYDNLKMIISQLVAAGIKSENIEYSVLCTIDNNDLHSFRRDKENSGRMAVYIGLKKRSILV